MLGTKVKALEFEASLVNEFLMLPVGFDYCMFDWLPWAYTVLQFFIFLFPLIVLRANPMACFKLTLDKVDNSEAREGAETSREQGKSDKLNFFYRNYHAVVFTIK